MDDRIVIVVPGNPSLQTGSNRGASNLHKSRDVAELRTAAMYATIEQADGRAFIGPVSVSVLVRWAKGERRKDLDSVAVMCKPAIDGVVDGEAMRNDSQMHRLTVEQERAKDGVGAIVITLEAIA